MGNEDVVTSLINQIRPTKESRVKNILAQSPTFNSVVDTINRYSYTGGLKNSQLPTTPQSEQRIWNYTPIQKATPVRIGGESSVDTSGNTTDGNFYFETDFGSGLYDSLYLLGPYAILENFETRTDDEIGSDLADTNKWPFVETFEDSSVQGYMVYPSSGVSGSIGEAFAFSPLNISVDVNGGSITLGWNDLSIETSYEIYRGLDTSSYALLDILPQDITSYVDSSSLVEDVTYYYRVDAVSGGDVVATVSGDKTFRSVFTVGVPYSLEFNNNNSIQTTATTDFNFGTGDFTISMWLMQYTYGSLDTLCELNVYYNGILIRPSGTSLQIYIDGSLRQYSGGWATSTTLNDWNYFVLSRTSGVVKLYINDMELDSYSNSSHVSLAGDTLGFGVSLHSTTSQRFNGRMNHIKIYNKGMTLSEAVTDKFIPTADDPNLILYYKLDEGSGLVANDETGNHDGVIEEADWI